MKSLSLEDKADSTKSKTKSVRHTNRFKNQRQTITSKKKKWIFNIYYNDTWVGFLTEDGRYFYGTEYEAKSKADKLYNDYISKSDKKIIKFIPG